MRLSNFTCDFLRKRGIDAWTFGTKKKSYSYPNWRWGIFEDVETSKTIVISNKDVTLSLYELDEYSSERIRQAVSKGKPIYAVTVGIAYAGWAMTDDADVEYVNINIPPRPDRMGKNVKPKCVRLKVKILEDRNKEAKMKKEKKELKQYAVPVKAEKPFDFKQFQQDWDKDGGKWRLIITPPIDADGNRRGFLFTRISKEVLARAGVSFDWCIVGDDLDDPSEGLKLLSYHSKKEKEKLIIHCEGCRRWILRMAKARIDEIEAKINETRYVLVYGDF